MRKPTRDVRPQIGDFTKLRGVVLQSHKNHFTQYCQCHGEAFIYTNIKISTTIGCTYGVPSFVTSFTG